MSDRNTPLDEHEIKMMRAYLDKFPPLVPPHDDLPYFDILRICATLERLSHCDRALCGAIAQRDHFARALRSIRDFAKAHHAEQELHVILHGLVVDIPDIVETVFEQTSEVVRRRCRREP